MDCNVMNIIYIIKQKNRPSAKSENFQKKNNIVIEHKIPYLVSSLHFHNS